MPQQTRTPATSVDSASTRPLAIDLFAGAGGLSLGLEQAGFDVLAALEYDPVHATTHEFNLPLTQVLCGDASQVEVADLLAAAAKGWTAHHPSDPWSGNIDLVAGGPPCQGFSWIGKRKVDDARNDLVFHFFRLVAGVRPKYFVMENVPGMLAGAHRYLLSDLIKRFEDEGYVVERPQVLNAADYGVPQDRRRVILIGSRSDCPRASHPAPTHIPTRAVNRSLRPLVDDLPTGPTVRDALGDLPDLDSYKALIISDSVRLPAPTLRRMRVEASSYTILLNGRDLDPDNHGHPRDWDHSLLTSSMRTQHTELSRRRFAATSQGETEPVSRFLRLPESGLCNTLRAGSGSERGAFTSPRPIHPVHPRVISVREAARLHSFPDWYRLHVTKWNGFRQIGNAVPPLLARAVGQAIVTALGVSPGTPTTPLPLGDERLLRLSMKRAASYTGAGAESMPKSRRRTTRAVSHEES
jgi:DNA (cytosine-5)-methyltransferase 1